MQRQAHCVMSFLAVLTLAACNSGGVVGSVPPPGSWSVVSVPTTKGLTNVRGSGPTDVWILARDTILRWDGQKWGSIPDSVVGLSAPVVGGVALWVNGPTDAWVGVGVKVADHWTGAPPWIATSLNDNRTATTFSASGPSDVWASDCVGGYLGHWDGTGWNHLAGEVGSAIWGSGTSDVWMIERSSMSGISCDSGSTFISHWSGITGFTGKQTQFTSPQNLRAIWGSGISDIWAVGEAGAIVHYDGTGWSPLTTSPTVVGLRGVWGTAANDVWAVGDRGVILHFDGSGWAKGVSPTTRTLRSVWGSPSGDAWAVGDSGTVLHLTR